jgi:hypothetical protein
MLSYLELGTGRMSYVGWSVRPQLAGSQGHLQAGSPDNLALTLLPLWL